MDTLLTGAVLGILVMEYAFTSFLEYLNYTHWQAVMPDSIRNFTTDKNYVRAFFYNQHKYNLSLFSRTVSFIVLFFMLYGGGFELADSIVRLSGGGPLSVSILFFLILLLGSEILSLPASWYGTFVIENKYGFNTSTIPLFLKDTLISLILSSFLISAFISVIVLLYQYMGKHSWILAWLVFAGFVLFIQYYYTSILLPLFNKLTPLDEGTLKEKIQNYAHTVQFPLDKIYIMDASKRSTKANAFFSGLGRRKTIVLHDTLIKNHSEEEIISVLAHETGHYKNRHIFKMMFFYLLISGFMLFLLFHFMDNPFASHAVGLSRSGYHGSILAYGILFGPISFIYQTVLNYYSRKFEYEADAYAGKTSDASSLAEALKKFSVEHLSNLNPHKLYVFFNYSHPTTAERIQKLEE